MINTRGKVYFSDWRCQAGWYYFNNSCYVFGRLQVNFTAASEICILNNAALASSSSEEENDFLKQL